MPRQQHAQKADSPRAVDAPQASPTAAPSVVPIAIAEQRPPQELIQPNVHAPRNRRPPQRFRDPEVPAIGTPPPDEPPPKAEFFNLDDVSNVDEEDNDTEDEDEPPIPRAWALHNAGGMPLNTVTQATDPLMMDTQTQSQNRSSADVHFFFTKCKGEGSVCNCCKKLKEDHPQQFPPERMYMYGPNTSNYSHRGHIEKYHLEEYLVEAEKNQ
ncbi:hypothetical protein PAXINDRAFT_6873 [Paxillus involutus ATCC 200175]|nr:hypothetical protein PAXINDRAFT_6873 [Paxillus involutus ATCC 200175]